MIRVVCVVAIVAGGCVMTPVMKFGEGKSAKQAQHDVLVEYLPARLRIEGDWKAQVHDVKIRVYADSDYRSQNVKWQQTFEQQLDYANAVLSSHFGIRMRPEYKVWERHGIDAPLEESLGALARMDPGSDVFAVVGLASSLTLVEATFEKLGVARLGGRHLVVRGFANLEERKAFAAAFPDLAADERENAHQVRKRHKNTAVFLHEIAHNLGVGHEEDDKTLMSPRYSHHASTFSKQTIATILRTIDHRLARPPSPGTDEAGPGATASQVDAPASHRSITVQIVESGAAVVDGKPTDNTSLSTLFTGLAGEDALTGIVIQKHRKAPAAAMATVMDLAKQAGLSRFTVTVY